MIVLSLILAHLIADFYLQTEKMVNEKMKFLKLHLFHHTLVTAMTLCMLYYLLGLSNFSISVLLPTVIIVIFHAVIDLAKIYAQKKVFHLKQKNGWNLALFVADQVFHLFTILAVCYFFLDVNLSDLLETVLVSLHMKDGVIAEKSLIGSTLFIMIMFILTTSVTGHFIKILLGSLTRHLSLFEGKYTLRDVEITATSQKSLSEEYTYMVMKHQDLSRGKVIGYLERLLVVALILMGSFPAVGFIVAAKSLTRFKQLDDRDWAEYFLLGTLSSFLFAILYGIILKIVFF
ncbi:DUF3307 domain-containing protein [Bacillus tianshenii]|uniref:DUF3307 domain-containing protein n=1 Tax=Sutcliffiella tianshenii TaxID=1463404 RepID=UPI001CD75EDF|nr:DUF3307 domain-containing protein [Bacillus tianshenii]MCA1319418.1 DUF3307 domain-containing protein [Bacillus tianshenii]